MNINEFKKGDFVTRNEPAEDSGSRVPSSYFSYCRDRSYMNNKLELVGVENQIIVLIQRDESSDCKPIRLSQDLYGEGWVDYPQDLMDEAQVLIDTI